MKSRIAIIDGLRSPFCKAGEVFRNYTADDLAARVSRELMLRIGLPFELVDEVVFGNVSQPMEAVNVARVIALKAGFPVSTPACTVHRNCASGMESITSAACKILAGELDVVLAGGTESMSNIPLFFGRKMTELFEKLMKAKTPGQKLKALAGFRLSHLTPVVGLMLGLSDQVCGLNMGQTAEVLAREFTVTR
ncbi:MAG: acetyl-CoA C-acyltransferase, partial [Planctomycetes bacterium]|nr:acetyl-CoA C-acyltransferase [Planctomycetota bacterium]